VVAAVVATRLRIIVLPLFVVDRDPHLWRITMVHAFAAAVVVVAPEVLWVIDVRIVVKPLHVLVAVVTTPGATERMVGCTGFTGGEGGAENGDAPQRENQLANHKTPLMFAYGLCLPQPT